MDQGVGRGQVQLHAHGELRAVEVVDARELAAQPFPAEGELVVTSRLHEGVEVREHLVWIEVDRGADEALVAKPGHHGVGVPRHGDAQQCSHGAGQAIGQDGDRTEVEHAQSAIVGNAEVARVRIRVHESRAGWTGEQEPRVRRTGSIPLLGRSRCDDRRQGSALQPFRDEHMR